MISEPIIKENDFDVKNYYDQHPGSYEQSSALQCLDIFKMDANAEMWNLPYVDITMKENDELILKLNFAEFIRFWQNNVHYFFVKDKTYSDIHKFTFVDGVYRLCDDRDMKALIQRMLPDPLRRRAKVNELFDMLQNDTNYVDEDDLNPEKYINFQNGLFNIRTREMEPHDPNIFSTIQLPLPYNPNLDYSRFKGGTFDTYMDHFLGSDKTQIQLALEFLGMFLSNIPGYKYKKALMIIGPGDTGKSVYRWLAERLLGKENYYICGLDKLENNRFQIANLHGKRLGGTADMEFMEIKELDVFKNLTGGDGVPAEHKGRPGFNFIFKGLLFFCTNAFPRFGGDKAKHVYNRFTIIRAIGKTYEKGSTPIPGAVEQDKELRDKLYGEREYIAHLALEALKTVIANNKFSETDLQAQEIEKFKNANNNIAAFFDECICERFDGVLSDRCTKAMLYKVYVKWAFDNHGKCAEGRNELYSYIESHGGEKGITNGYEFYKNFTLTPEIKETYKAIYGEDNPEYKKKNQAYLKGRGIIRDTA